MNKQLIATGMVSLADLDKDVAQALAQIGPPPPRLRPVGFRTLFSIIVSQQLSTEAAKAIMDRVEILLPEITAESLLSLDDQALRDVGLSFRKIEYAKGLAEAVMTGHFNVDSLVSMSDAEAVTSITSLRGFGRWSAEIYLMFSLRRQDIFPADDLALQVALGRLKKLPTKPTPNQAREIIAHWAPWRSVGSLFLWHYYRGAPT